MSFERSQMQLVERKLKTFFYTRLKQQQKNGLVQNFFGGQKIEL